MEKIKTATGRVFDTDMVAVNQSPERCYINILNKEFREVASVFGNPDETSELVYGDDNGMSFRVISRILGFNKIQGVSAFSGGYKVTLRRE